MYVTDDLVYKYALVKYAFVILTVITVTPCTARRPEFASWRYIDSEYNKKWGQRDHFTCPSGSMTLPCASFRT